MLRDAIFRWVLKRYEDKSRNGRWFVLVIAHVLRRFYAFDERRYRVMADDYVLTIARLDLIIGELGGGR